MEVCFVEVKSGKRHARRLPCLVGRGDDAGFRIKNDTVSRHHCTFTLDEGIVHVTDLGSTNGTAVADTKVDAQAKKPIPSGSQVRIGGVVLRVEYTASDAAARNAGEADTVPWAENIAADSVSLVESAATPAAPSTPTSADAAPPEPVASAEEPAAEPPAEVPVFADIDAAAPPVDLPSFPDVEPASAPADGSFEFLGGAAEAPPASDDKLDDFFKSLS
jgi:predicted component of type VI protein secretion system